MSLRGFLPITSSAPSKSCTTRVATVVAIETMRNHELARVSSSAP
jgi:hypothetical protein